MRVRTHRCDNFGSGVIILEENLVEICLIIAEKLLLMKCDLDLHFQGQLMRRFCCQPSSIILVYNCGDILIFVKGDLDKHFEGQLTFLLPTRLTSFL